MDIERILVNISNPEDYNLFRRVGEALGRRCVEVSYVANNLPIFLYLRVLGEKVYFPRIRPAPDLDLSNSFSVKTGRLSKARAAAVYQGFYEFFQKMQLKHHWQLVVLPSGRLVSQQGLGDAAKSMHVRRLFTGYGNIDNRIFADPQGTDKQSSLFNFPEKLDALDVDESDFHHWRTAYITARKQRHVVSQARHPGVRTYALKFIQILSCRLEKLLGLAGENDYSFKELGKVKPVRFRYDPMVEDQPYIFFPMQVSTDAQVILNYAKGNVMEGLKDAIAIAASRNRHLVVKPHPAELNQTILLELERLKRQHGFSVVEENTFRLLEKADAVVTINSTVAIEAMFFGKEVIFLGESIYSRFNQRRLAAYIMCYLLNENYFAKTPIGAGSARRLLSMASQP